MSTPETAAETPVTGEARYTDTRSVQTLGNSIGQILPPSVIAEMGVEPGDQQRLVICGNGVFIPYE